VTVMPPAIEPEAPPVRVSLPSDPLKEQRRPAPELPPVPAIASVIDKNDKPLAIPDHVLTPTLADIYFQQGQPNLAVKIYRRLLEKDPGNGKLQQRIEEIETVIARGIEAGVPVAPVPASQPVKVVKKESKSSARTRPPAAEDPRPLAGVRLKKKAKMKWKKRKSAE
jgi:hypothetical protein